MAPCQKRELAISVLFDVIIFSFINQFQASTLSKVALSFGTIKLTPTKLP